MLPPEGQAWQCCLHLYTQEFFLLQLGKRAEVWLRRTWIMLFKQLDFNCVKKNQPQTPKLCYM